MRRLVALTIIFFTLGFVRLGTIVVEEDNFLISEEKLRSLCNALNARGYRDAWQETQRSDDCFNQRALEQGIFFIYVENTLNPSMQLEVYFDPSAEKLRIKFTEENLEQLSKASVKYINELNCLLEKHDLPILE